MKWKRSNVTTKNFVSSTRGQDLTSSNNIGEVVERRPMPGK